MANGYHSPDPMTNSETEQEFSCFFVYQVYVWKSPDDMNKSIVFYLVSNKYRGQKKKYQINGFRQT